MSKLNLTLACGDYEIVRALKEGTVQPDGIDLTVLTAMDSGTRHWRFLRDQEFDIAELSCSSYFVARDQGLQFDAIPVFLHRRFRHGFMFINTSKGIKRPTDLIGRKVGVKQFQSSAIVWMRGILEHEYGVPHRSIEWFSEIEENVEFEMPSDLKITQLPEDQSVEDMLAEGKLDAALHPELLLPIIRKDPRVARLFPDYREEEMAYYKKTGIFPIMHLMGIKREIVEKYPWVPMNIFNAFNEAKAIAMRRMVNPRIVPLVFYRDFWEEQEEVFGADPWEYGLTERNRHALDTLAGYVHEQGQTTKKLSVDDLFLKLFADRARGAEERI